MPRRCELGCPYTSGVTHHRFPHPERNPDRFKDWVLLMGGNLEATDLCEVYKNRVICDRHFKMEDKNRNNRLNCMAVPSLHLSGVTAMEGVEVPNNNVTVADVFPATSETPVISIENIFSLSSNNQHFVKGVTAMERVEVPNNNLTVADVFPATSETLVLPTETISSLSSNNQHCVEEKYGDLIRVIAADHNYYYTQEKTVSNENREIVPKKSTPSAIADQLKTSRKHIKSLQTEIRRMRKRCKRFKERLASAEKIRRNNYFEILTRNMTEPAKVFTKMQFTQTLKKRGGRRFTSNEKFLSLSIYKISPKTYSLLCKYFTMPSAKCMKRLLSQLSRHQTVH